ncbi:hypothetical protein [Flavobacterium luteum]|uniref:Uncharacterized protein n=1 Tax=Flavobacterium luteum TaxID=2026654 RepID=A0A7J5A814_9FLAO|nr:hypothetical protein [Flavobacterium luteum]KAB1153710.1 hypothetical protein F6464_14080 [Flavobacterium luteum]
MSVITFEDYTAAIKGQYEEVKSGIYSSFLLNPTPAQLRNLCLLILDNGLSKVDEGIFTLFFQVKQGENLRRSIENFDIEKFKAIKNFLIGKNGKTNPNNLNLIAVLVDFQPRPFSKFIHQGPMDLNKFSNEISINKEEIVNTISQQNSFPDNRTVNLKRSKRRSIAVAISIVGMALGGYGVKKEFFPDKECMQWNNDHYEEVVCEGSEIGFASINPIFDKDESLFQLKKIEVSDTTTFFKNDQPIVWYSKRDGKCEFFNAPGLHPESRKTLRPVSKYIIKKYVLTVN